MAPTKPASTPTHMEENNADVARPTPLVIKKRFNNLEPKKEREGVVIAEEAAAEPQLAVSEQLPAGNEEGSSKRKPELKVKKYLERMPYTEKIPEI